MALTAKLEPQSNSVPRATATQLPPKKPAQSHNYYLRARIWYVLCNIDRIIPRKARYEVQDRLWSMWRDLRDSKGVSRWELACAALFLVGIGIFAMSLRETGYTYSAPETKFRVLEQINSHDFILQRVENGIPQYPTELHFCHDYQPRFEPGMTLVFLSYSDRGSCVSIAPKDKWYVVEKGAHHWPTLPNNCRQDLAHNHVVCNGKPQF
jgi:hypothetical protein